MTVTASPNQLQGVAVVTGAGSGVSCCCSSGISDHTFPPS